MRKKLVIAIGVFVVIIIGSFLFNDYLLNTEKEITLDAALEEMPYISISPNEISLMTKLKNDPDIQQAMREQENDGEIVISFSAGELTNIEKTLFPENSVITVIAATVTNEGIVVVEYSLDGYSISLLSGIEDSIHKTILLLRADYSVKAAWENHNNETYKKLRFGLFHRLNRPKSKANTSL